MALVQGTGGPDGPDNPDMIGTNGPDTIDGLAGNDWIQSLGGNDTLIGGTGSDALWSSGGVDTMTGGNGAMTGDLFGNDTYHVDNAGDVIIEYTGQGTDRVHAYITFDMNTVVNIENMRLVGFSTGLDATGNDLGNTIEGNRERNTLVGGLGDDSYVIYSETDASKKDIIIENAGEGSDTWIVNFTYVLEDPSFNVENITLTGNKLINATGNAVDNVLTGNSAKNTLTGLAGNDTYVIQATTDVIKENANEGNDTVVIKDTTYSVATQANLENIQLTGNLAVNATGNASDNILGGNDGSNVLNGLGGADTMTGLKGNDTYVVDNIADVAGEGGANGGGLDIVLSSVTYTLATDIDNITLTGGANVNGFGNALGNTLTGNTGVNTLGGGAGDDYYYIQNTGDFVTESIGGGTDRIYTTANFNMDTNADQAEIITLLGTLGIGAIGNGLYNTMNGNGGANAIFGGGGRDTIYGNAGNDSLRGDDDIDTLFGGTGLDSLSGGDGDDSLDGGASQDILNGGGGDDSLFGNDGTDTFIGGTGNDIFSVGLTTEIIIDYIGEGVDTVAAPVSYVLPPVTANQELENLSLDEKAIFGIGNEINNRIYGTSASNTLAGMAGNDFLHDDLGGDDTLIGGTGADTLRGEIGNDSYYVDNVADQVVEFDVNHGLFDAIYASVSYDMSVVSPGFIEYLYLTGSAVTGIGNDNSNTLVGNSLVNTLAGGQGGDGYIVDNAVDVIIEYAGQGGDTIFSSITYTLAPVAADYEVEGLFLTGKNTINGTGNTGDNTLAGNTGVNTLTGGLGNDWYFVDDLDDVNKDTFVELTGGGDDDGILAKISVTLKTASPTYDIENVALLQTDDMPDININATGNALENTLIGNEGNNTLDGSTGTDYLIGDKGNDTFILDTATDVVTEGAGGGNDTIFANFTYSLTNDVNEVENLTLYGNDAIDGEGNDVVNKITGNIAANTLWGMDGNDTIDGGGDADVMIGGDDNDLYIVDNELDVITELVGEGTDTVRNSASFDMSTQAPGELEIMVMTGTLNINGTGNAFKNTMTGNTGNNIISGGAGEDTILGLAGDDYLSGGDDIDTIDGGTGIDTMAGNLGNDVYIITSATKTIIEALGEGIDEVRSSLTHTLEANVDNLTLTGSLAINGFGNELTNVIKGNANVNTINGGAGVDTMLGAGGSDVFIVDDAGDIVTENGGEGTADTILSSVTYDMGVSATGEVENLTLTGVADIDGTGNGEHNTITGNAGINTMNGGLGNDFYVVQSLLDVADDAVGEGEDTILSAITWALNNIEETENIFLLGTGAINATGNDLGNSLIGNSGKNILNGGLGDDTYGLGTSATNDTIVLDSGGNDTVIVGASYSIATRGDLENITLTGTGLFNATGNANVNILYGNTGKNTLNGGAGADTMIGGLGDDTFFVDNVGDVTEDRLIRPVEEPDALKEADLLPGGKDLVISSVSYSLSEYLDNLTLTNVATAISGTGNLLNNVIKGNSFNNILNGAQGADTLEGGAGNDSYVIDTAGDVIKDTSGIDHVFSSLGVYTLGTGLENLTLIGPNPINGTGNTGNNTITGNANNNIIDGGAGADVMIGGGADNEIGDVYYVDRVTDTVIGDTGKDSVFSKVTYSLDNAFSQEVENLTLTGTTGLNATGNALDNTLYGNTGVNTITGGDGNDFLSGGAGKDVLIGGNGADTFYFEGATAFKAVDTILDYEIGVDTIFFDAIIDPLLQVTEDFLEFVQAGSNVNVFLDYDGQGEAYSPQLIAILINP